MQNPETHQLRITATSLQVKEDLKNWLIGCGEETFVEGALDDLFEDPSYEVTADVQFDNLGGDLQPIFVYKYDREHLLELQSSLNATFGELLTSDLSTISTESWKEGWKESFKPIETASFYIYPPWLADSIPSHLIPIEIEPGMAFGTGQHATTVLCMKAIERFHEHLPSKNLLLDVGTGTGILAIAGAKLGFARALGTDIDPDSIIASRDNALRNKVELDLVQTSVPALEEGADLLVANIIFFVLKQIIAELSAQVKVGGLLILSGLLDEEMRDMEALAVEQGLSLVQEETLDDWACQVYRKLPL